MCSNPYITERLHKKMGRNLEIKLLKNCNIFCPMKSHSPIFENRVFDKYSAKIRYMDIPSLLVELNEIEEEEYIINHDNLTIVYTGNLSKLSADPTYFFDLIPLLKMKINFHVELYGGISEELKSNAISKGLWGNIVTFYGNISQEELVDIRKKADVFLNFGNEHSCGIPSKLFEYLSTGKPILSFYKIEDDASKKYLSDEKLALLIPESMDSCLATEKIDAFLKEIKVCKVDSERLKTVYYDNTPYPMANLIQEYL